MKALELSLLAACLAGVAASVFATVSPAAGTLAARLVPSRCQDAAASPLDPTCAGVPPAASPIASTEVKALALLPGLRRVD
ncbi:MAG: hypothetical protein AAGD12_06635 [Pseudomonadota bacterium]